eukprot:SRR837773.2480.p3 GENE.SRR837773.2480~~SRR837773.2480.p3  ORF type:complete len:119 (+),score=38.79 SRR837773.2480:1-357(+)
MPSRRSTAEAAGLALAATLLSAVQAAAEATAEPEARGGLMVSVMVVAGVLLILCGGYQAYRYLVAPKKTPAPLLADNELCEGDPVQDSASAMWMGGGGSQARQVVSDSQPAGAGFTQF